MDAPLKNFKFSYRISDLITFKLNMLLLPTNLKIEQHIHFLSLILNIIKAQEFQSLSA